MVPAGSIQRSSYSEVEMKHVEALSAWPASQAELHESLDFVLGTTVAEVSSVDC